MKPIETKVSCFYYGITGNVDHIPAWRHFQTVTDRLAAGQLRLDGEWYRRVIRSVSGEEIPALGIWNPETDVTMIIVGREFPDQGILLREIQGPTLPEQLRAEEWHSNTRP